ncbi:small ribosomal subunit protein mS31-like isoform X2 [Haliotis asinina]|uniref:small ribosomal subunit protein mS31-like isoform X2 n=1 Tax=Haliotis asinina TaxID=109174 RepID=UPI00353270F6
MNLQRLRLPHLKLLLECSRQWMTNVPSSVAIGERLGAARHFSGTHQLNRKKKFPSEEDTDTRETDGVDSSLKEAAKSVASSLPGDAKQTESDLLQQLHNQAKLAQTQRQGREVIPKGSPKPRQKSQRPESESKTASNTRQTRSKPLDFYFHEDESRGKDTAPKDSSPRGKDSSPKGFPNYEEGSVIWELMQKKKSSSQDKPRRKDSTSSRDALQPEKARSRDTRSRESGSRELRSRQESLLQSKASHRSPTLRDDPRGWVEARGQDLSAWQDSVLPDRPGQRGPRTQSAAAKQRQIRNFKLFAGEGLGIFDHVALDKTETTRQRSLWDEVQEETLAALQQNPTNAFEEMIEWTKEGKLWTFPINNEAGMLEEQNVSFSEHVFLDQHLEGFPTRGPVRHFMDLVTTGLSQNPHLTVQQKKDHIEWFRRYFTEKQAVLEENLGPDGVMKEVVDTQLQSQ